MSDWLHRLNPYSSLRAQISFATGGVILVLSFTLSFFAAEQSRKQIEQDQGDAFVRRATGALDVLNRGMFERVREIQNAAVLDAIREPGVAVAHKREFLERLQTSFTSYAWIGICDAQGRGLVGTGKYLEGKDLSQRPWCNKGRTGPYVGDMHDALMLSKLLPNPSGQPFYLLDVASPLFDKHGVLQGVLCGHVYWNWVEESLDSKKTPGKDILLVSADGLVLSGPVAPRSELGKLAPDTLRAIQESHQNDGYLLEQWSDGKTYLVGYAKSSGYRDYQGLGWVSLVRQDVTQAFAPAKVLQHRIFLMGLLLSLLFAWLSWYMTGRIVRPLVRMSRAADRIALGELRYDEPEYQGEGEVAHLSVAIHRMVNNLTDEIAKRKQVEAELRIAATAFESHEGIMIVDAEVRIKKVNLAFTTITGYSEEEVIGQNPKLLNSGRQDAQFYANMWVSLKTAGMWEGDIWNRRKNGEIYPQHLSITALKDEAGKVVSYVAELTDASARIAMEERLKQSESKFRALFQSADDCLLLLSMDGKILDINQSGHKRLGYTREEMLGRRISEFDPPEYADKVPARLAQIMTEGQVTFETAHLHKDGRIMPVEVNCKLVEINGERQFYSVIRDVSARKESEREFAQRSFALDHVNEAVYLMDEHGRFLYVNDEACRVLGYTRAELLGGMGVPDIGVNWTDGMWNAHWSDVQAHGFRVLEAEHRAKDGRVFSIEVNANFFKYEGQGYVISLVRDITERKLAEDKIKALNVDLERRVLERTNQLQLANHAKDSFLATMSHEIRTPLAGLLGMMELLSLSKLEQEQSELLHAAQKSGNSLLRIVNDILDWSKIEAGKLELSPHVGNISELFESVSSTYAQLATEKDIVISIDIDPALSAAHVFDALRVSQILNNFTSNALKFTERGNIKLSAQRLAQGKGRETVCFSVQDSGVGISAEQQARLFQQYEQGSAATARMYGGTGLGLAICRRLAELMGGTLSVQSTPGSGSTFSFTVELPVVEQTAAQARLQHDVAEQAATDVSPLTLQGRAPRLLIVDDHPLNRMLLKQQLSMLGVVVEQAVDGNDALEKYQASSFDLVITDCHMPEMDGYELSYRIRNLEKAAGIRMPIIAWTANALAEEAEHCHKAGMDDLLTKPTELADLRFMLAKWLAKMVA